MNASTFADWIRMENVMGAAPSGRNHSPVCLQLATAAAAASFSSSTAAQETQQPIIVKKTVKPRKGALKGRQRQKERVDLIQRQNESEAEFTKRKNAFLCTPTVSS